MCAIQNQDFSSSSRELAGARATSPPPKKKTMLQPLRSPKSPVVSKVPAPRILRRHRPDNLWYTAIGPNAANSIVPGETRASLKLASGLGEEFCPGFDYAVV
ncbi:hypothetical protein PMIN03_004160 [Paraphaeosphaeria minitans]